MVDHLFLWGMLFAAWVPHGVSGRASAAAFFYSGFIGFVSVRVFLSLPYRQTGFRAARM